VTDEVVFFYRLDDLQSMLKMSDTEGETVYNVNKFRDQWDAHPHIRFLCLSLSLRISAR